MITYIRPLYALAVVLAAVSPTRGGDLAGNRKAPTPLPHDVVTAWQKAGADAAAAARRPRARNN
jgi:hypothetical protein